MLTFSYSLMHFLEDGLCAFAMYTVFLHRPDAYLYILIYNFCAFALQMPLGALVDLLREKQAEATGRFRMLPLSALTAVLGVFVTFFGALLHPAVLGLGNALFHVGGGIGTIDEDRQKKLKGQALGIFVAPGAMGLFLGTVIGKVTPGNRFGLGLLAILFAFMLATMILYLSMFVAERKRLAQELAEKKDSGTPKNTGLAEKPSAQTPFTGFAFLASALCFLVVVVRSHVGMSIGFSWKQGTAIGVLATAMVVGGKMLGGILAAHIGRKITVVASLVLAALCYFFSDHMAFGLLALLFFNMTMPITLQLLVDRFPHLAGFNFGLLTFALFIGFLPVWFRLQNPASGNIIGMIFSLLSLALLLGSVLLLERERKE